MGRGHGEEEKRKRSKTSRGRRRSKSLEERSLVSRGWNVGFRTRTREIRQGQDAPAAHGVLLGTRLQVRLGIFQVTSLVLEPPPRTSTTLGRWKLLCGFPC
ncbi:hypothetical protein MTO96_037142 [Rhipicephalus appendiculatus]